MACCKGEDTPLTKKIKRHPNTPPPHKNTPHTPKNAHPNTHPNTQKKHTPNHTSNHAPNHPKPPQKHPEVIPIPFRYHSEEIPIPFRSHFEATQKPPKYRPNTTQIPPKYRPDTIQIPPKYRPNTAQTPPPKPHFSFSTLSFFTLPIFTHLDRSRRLKMCGVTPFPPPNALHPRGGHPLFFLAEYALPLLSTACHS